MRRYCSRGRNYHRSEHVTGRPACPGGYGRCRGKDEAEQPDAIAPADEDQAAGDARHDARKLKENRDKLGVGDDHKTPEMKKHYRGTFP